MYFPFIGNGLANHLGSRKFCPQAWRRLDLKENPRFWWGIWGNVRHQMFAAPGSIETIQSTTEYSLESRSNDISRKELIQLAHCMQLHDLIQSDQT